MKANRGNASLINPCIVEHKHRGQLHLAVLADEYHGQFALPWSFQSKPALAKASQERLQLLAGGQDQARRSR